MFQKKRIYFDYAGATYIEDRVRKIMYRANKNMFANPSAIFYSGVKVREAIEKARIFISSSINAHKDEIIFTGSGTESNAVAILGVIKKFKEKNPLVVPHIITTSIEHPSVLENLKSLEESGEITVTYISPDENGLISHKDIKDSIKENTILVSIMYANNEIGTINPIIDIAKEIRFFRKKNNSIFPFFHTDACQAMNYLYTDNIEKLGVDLMTFNSSKIYGPKGIGVLYKKRSVELSPVYLGGGQEYGLRSGTESLPLILGLKEALRITNKIKNKESARLTNIRNYLIDKLFAIDIAPFKIILNGERSNRLPNNVNISVLGINSELLVIELDARGIEVSEKSACHSDDEKASYVVKTVRKDIENVDKYGSVRISLGRRTSKKDVDFFLKQLNKILLKYRGVI